MADAIDKKPDTVSNVSTCTSVSSSNHSALVSSSAIAPYINATGSASFANCPITFNIHSYRAEKARQKLKRKHSAE